MPLRKDIKKVLVIGSGPIVIGQAAEFDYSGTQACQALKEEGLEVVLVNSNPATIMTDKEIADKIYIEPLTVEFVEKVIAKERPDSIIAGMGGQTGLNITVELHDKGILDKYNVKVIGTSIASIKEGEDRELFRDMMNRINEPVIQSEIITDLEAGVAYASKIGYPVIVRPAYTLVGTGGGIADNEEELLLSLQEHVDGVKRNVVEVSFVWIEVVIFSSPESKEFIPRLIYQGKIIGTNETNSSEVFSLFPRCRSYMVEISGTATVTKGSCKVVMTENVSQEVRQGDALVIKGVTYRVDSNPEIMPLSVTSIRSLNEKIDTGESYDVGYVNKV